MNDLKVTLVYPDPNEPDSLDIVIEGIGSVITSFEGDDLVCYGFQMLPQASETVRKLLS